MVIEGFSITKHVETKAGAADLVTEFDQRVEQILDQEIAGQIPDAQVRSREDECT